MINGAKKNLVFESKGKLLKGSTLMVLSIFIMSFGVAISTRAGLGTSPISSLPYVLSLGIPLTYGTFTFIMNAFLILFQFLLLKKDLSIMLILQIPVLIIFSFFSDWTLSMVQFIVPSNYLEQWVLTILSTIILAFGISVEMNAKFATMPGEGMVFAMSRRFKTEFGRMKVVFDVTLVLSAVIASVLMFGGLVGVREGTIFAALTVGHIVRFLMKLMSKNEKTVKTQVKI